MSNLKEWIGWNWGITIWNGIRISGYEIVTIFECIMQLGCASIVLNLFFGYI